MIRSRKNSRRAIKQSLMVLATIAVLPTTTGALANTLAESMGLTPGYQVAPPATKPYFLRTRSVHIEKLEKSVAELRLRVQRLEAEGQEQRAAILRHRIGRLEAELERLRNA